MFKKLNILYAEDEEFIRDNLIEALEFMGMNVKAVTNGEDAYKQYLLEKPDIIIADIEMPHLSGLDLAKKVREKDNSTQIIIATAYTNTEYFLKAVELNLAKYLLKPISLIDLKNALETCIEKLDFNDENSDKYFNKEDYYSLSQRCLFVNKKVVRLDFHEREFLELLLRNSQRIVTYAEFESKVWDNNMSSAALRSLVRNLRKKLPENVIENVSKIGYKILLKR